MKKTAVITNQKGEFLKSIFKGTLISLSVSILGICIFAFLLRFIDINVNYIKPVNQVIKIVSVFIGSFYGLKNVKEMGLISGFIIGTFYTFLSFIIFSFLNGGISFTPSLVNDLIFGGITGAICGIVCVNLIKKTK